MLRCRSQVRRFFKSRREFTSRDKISKSASYVVMTLFTTNMQIVNENIRCKGNCQSTASTLGCATRRPQQGIRSVSVKRAPKRAPLSRSSALRDTNTQCDLLTVRGVAHLVVHGVNNWLDQLRNDATRSIGGDLWRRVCCRPWTWWCNDATALAGFATMMM